VPRVEVSERVDASLAETWEAFFDPSGWPRWVDAFAGVLSADGYPLGGGRLVWRTGAAGRGEVTEEVVEHEPRSLHVVSFYDPTMSGTLETRFVMEGGQTRVTQAVDYRLAQRGLFALLGALWVRGQIVRSVERSLSAFRAYVAETAE
jgi:uncharacterized protein YndB with AHSA1/START domain